MSITNSYRFDYIYIRHHEKNTNTCGSDDNVTDPLPRAHYRTLYCTQRHLILVFTCPSPSTHLLTIILSNNNTLPSKHTSIFHTPQ